MSDDKAAENPPEAGPTSAKGGKIIPIILLLNTGLMAALFLLVLKKPTAPVAASASAGQSGEQGSPEKGAGTETEVHVKPGPILKLENFVIQLKTADTDRYVRLALDVELLSEADKTAVTDYLSHIRDVVISYFADRTLDELRGSEAMEKTKAVLMKKIESVVPGRRIKNLYITDFIVQ